MEILSPISNFNTLYAAARTGADAVYFGVGEFNARRNAENFSNEDLKSISSYCHIRNIKAYLALNTLINDDEIPQAMKLVQAACEAGIDGIIINDTGLFELVKKAAPNMPLHASTQMTVHNIDGIKYLKEKGYNRVVLARENSLNDIKEISEYADNNGIELEIFVQGAHCMSVSGQCLLSSVLGCRSGNRGLCAQPCRLPFKVKNGNGYDLSLKDMNLFEYFDEFKKLNIASLKIEGRMKSEEYVAAATYSAYCFKTNASQKAESLYNLRKTFSRSGFTDGYLNQTIDKNMFGIRSEQDIKDSNQIKNSIHELYRREKPTVKISIKANFFKDKPSSLTISDGIHSLTVEDMPPEEAKNKSTTIDEISAKLSKLGSTPYFSDDISITIDNNLFVSGKIISNLKNKTLDELTELRGKIKPIPFFYQNKKENYKQIDVIPEKFICVHSLSQITDKNDADVFFIPLSSDLQEVKELINKGYTLGIKTPVFYNKLSKSKLQKFRSMGIEYALSENICSINTLKELEYIIIASPSVNIFNSVALEHCPADYCTLSVELSENQINNLVSNKPKGLYVYGRLPLMVFRNCPIKANNSCNNCDNKIIDRKNIEFPVFCEDGVTKMYNSRPLYVGDKTHLYNHLDFILLSFTVENKDEIKNILSDFKMKSEFKGTHTKGLYFKGVY